MVGFSEHHWFGARHVVVILLSFSQALGINFMFVIDRLSETTYQQSHATNDIFRVLNDMPRQNIKYYSLVSEFLGIIFNIIVGILTLKISNKYFLLLNNALNAVISFLLPFLLKVTDSNAFGASMIVFSMSRRIHWCTNLSIIGKWIPPHEQCRCLAVVFGLGYVFGCSMYIIADVIREKMNYSNSFYFLGTVCTLWIIFWFLFGAGSPDECAFTTEGEKRYIYKTLEYIRPINSKTPIPWKAIFKCRSMYTASVAITIFYQSLTSLAFSEFQWASIFSIILSQSKEEVERNLLPRMVGMPVFVFVMAYISDKLTTHHHWPTSYFRKIFATIGSYGACICISFMLYFNNQNSVLMFILATYFYAMQSSCAHLAALLDISPTYIGITFALASCPFMVIEFMFIFYSRSSVTVKTIEQLTHIFEGTIFTLIVGNIIFCMGTYERSSFDLIGTVTWKKESIQSYPAVKI